MIIRVFIDGAISVIDAADSVSLKVEMTGRPNEMGFLPESVRKLVRPDGAIARVSVSRLLDLDGYREAPDWSANVATLVENAGRYDGNPGEIAASLEWIAPHRRNRTMHGVTVGILMLDTGFERLPGDVGNAQTWPFPVQYAVVRGATSRNIVARSIDPDILERFVDAAHELVRLGADGIATSCGFLALLHPILRERIPVPVATSALLQIPLVQQTLPHGRRVGVLTMSKDSLTPDHFRAVGAPTDLPVGGIPFDSIFRQSQLTNKAAVSYQSNEQDILLAARQLIDKNPDIGALVLECTNMPPYSARLQEEFGMPVFDVYTMISWFHAGLQPRRHG